MIAPDLSFDEHISIAMSDWDILLNSKLSHPEKLALIEKSRYNVGHGVTATFSYNLESEKLLERIKQLEKENAELKNWIGWGVY